ncbi:unnamed protein product [Rotaria socialis]|nr:unnamed protein product [Rotaria socialis]
MKIKKYSLDLPDGVLAYRVLKSANVTDQEQQLARATLSDLTYYNMKQQLKKIFGNPNGEGVSSSTDGSFGGASAIKVEPVLIGEETNPLEFDKDYALYSHNSRGRYASHSRFNRNQNKGNARGGCSVARSGFRNMGHGENPLDKQGIIHQDVSMAILDSGCTRSVQWRLKLSGGPKR